MRTTRCFLAAAAVFLALPAGSALAAPGKQQAAPAATSRPAAPPAPVSAAGQARIGQDCAGLAGAERHACVYTALSKARTASSGTVTN